MSGSICSPCCMQSRLGWYVNTDLLICIIEILASVNAGDFSPACHGYILRRDGDRCSTSGPYLSIETFRLLPAGLPCHCIMVIHL